MTRARTPLILGNWKMNTSLDQAVELADAAGTAAESNPRVDVGILPPSLWLVPILQTLPKPTRLLVGSQHHSAHVDGAHTGDLSASMLAPWCDFALIGHSERRQDHGETDDVVRAQLDAALTVKSPVPWAPVLAVGERLEQREAGDAITVVESQLASAMAGRPADDLARVVVAYEPVWAIGTGHSATANDAQEMCAAIRAWIASRNASVAPGTRILYGGSMNGDNAAALLAGHDVDGGLVGGASLDADAFAAIVAAAATAVTATGRKP